MKIRAFLSYSHEDAEIVDAVANSIGRPFVIIDRISFKPGDEVVEAMDRSAAESAVFVAFVSKASLNSHWVKHEYSEARIYAASGRIRHVLVVLLDSRLSVGDLPPWMGRFKSIQSWSAKPIARLIRSEIDDVVHEVQSPHFVGRSSELREAQSALVPIHRERGSNFVVLRGLPGVGRRSILLRAAKDSIQIDRILVVRVEVGDSTAELATKLADLVEPANSPQESIGLARDIAALDADELTKRFTTDCYLAVGHRELVALYDEGGLLDNSGHFHGDLAALLSTLAREIDLPLGIITSRRPKWESIEFDEPFVISVNPLPAADIRQLVALVARNMNVAFNHGDTEVLATAANGYPPAVPIIVSRAKEYGTATFDKGVLPRGVYNPRQLSRYLENLQLSSTSQKLAAVLAANSPLPIAVLSNFAGRSDNAIDAVVELIDASIACHDSVTSWYRVSEPARQYILDSYPPCTIDEYSLLAESLDEYLSNSDSTESYLDLSRVLFRALKRAGEKATKNAYSLVSDWINLAALSYHQRDYLKSLEFAKEAFEVKPTVDSVQWIVKSQVKLGNFDEAFKSITKIRGMGEEREANFLCGFAERHRADYRQAIKYYERARSQGRGGTSILRDLADCYLHSGDLANATKFIADAQTRDPSNRYLISLRIKIACMDGDEATARQLLPELMEVDSPMFANHRASRVELRFGSASTALIFAERAYSAAPRPPFEVQANLALCQILAEDYSGAQQTMARMHQSQAQKSSDVIHGLNARLAIAQNDFESAVSHCDLIENLKSRIHIRVKRDAIFGLLGAKFVSSNDRHDYEEELKLLTVRLQSASPSDMELVDE